MGELAVKSKGQLDDLDAAAIWGRTHGVPVFSDECYVEFTWDGHRRTILENGLDGVVAVHSLSKRSNLAGARWAFTRAIQISLGTSARCVNMSA